MNQPNTGDDGAAEQKRLAALRRKYPEHFVKQAGKWVLRINPDWNLYNADWLKQLPSHKKCLEAGEEAIRRLKQRRKEQDDERR